MREREGRKKAGKRTTKPLLIYLCILLGSSLWNPITASASYTRVPPPRPLMLCRRKGKPPLTCPLLPSHSSLPSLLPLRKSKRKLICKASLLTENRENKRTKVGEGEKIRGGRGRGRKQGYNGGGCKWECKRDEKKKVVRRRCVVGCYASSSAFSTVLFHSGGVICILRFYAAEISGERGRPGFAAKLFRTSCQPVCIPAYV